MLPKSLFDGRMEEGHCNWGYLVLQALFLTSVPLFTMLQELERGCLFLGELFACFIFLSIQCLTVVCLKEHGEIFHITPELCIFLDAITTGMLPASSWQAS